MPKVSVVGVMCARAVCIGNRAEHADMGTFPIGCAFAVSGAARTLKRSVLITPTIPSRTGVPCINTRPVGCQCRQTRQTCQHPMPRPPSSVPGAPASEPSPTASRNPLDPAHPVSSVGRSHGTPGSDTPQLPCPSTTHSPDMFGGYSFAVARSASTLRVHWMPQHCAYSLPWALARRTVFCYT
jgi:hypothetical protein